MKKSLISAVVMCTLALTYITCSDTCQWPQYLANPQRTGYIPCDGPNAPDILWKTNISGGTDVPPLIIEDTVLILRKDSCAHPRESSLLEINLDTGQIENRLNSSTQGLFYDFFSDGSNIYIKGHKEIFRIDLDKKILESVASVSNIRCRFRCHPIVLEDKIIYPTTPVLCFSRPDFEVLWNTETIFPDHTTTTIMNAAASKSYIFMIVKQRGVKEREFYALHINTGEIAWNLPFSEEFFEIAVETPIVFVGGEKIYAINVDTGEIFWEFTPQGKIFTNLIVGPAYIFAVDSENQLYALNKETGREMWRTQWEGDPGWTFLLGGGSFLYCASGLGERSKITCFSTQDGTKVWEYMFDQEIHTDTALSQGILVVALLRGDIYAFATEPGDNSQPSKTPPPTSPEPSPDTSPPASAEPSQSPPGPEPSHVPEYLIVAGIIGGILLLYAWQKYK